MLSLTVRTPLALGPAQIDAIVECLTGAAAAFLDLSPEWVEVWVNPAPAELIRVVIDGKLTVPHPLAAPDTDYVALPGALSNAASSTTGLATETTIVVYAPNEAARGGKSMAGYRRDTEEPQVVAGNTVRE